MTGSMEHGNCVWHYELSSRCINAAEISISLHRRWAEEWMWRRSSRCCQVLDLISCPSLFRSNVFRPYNAPIQLSEMFFHVSMKLIPRSRVWYFRSAEVCTIQAKLFFLSWLWGLQRFSGVDLCARSIHWLRSWGSYS